MENLNCSATADWFNQQGVPVGPYCDRKEWYGAMVRRYYGNPILKGMPCRGKRHTVKHHEKGKRVSVPNPKGPNLPGMPSLGPPQSARVRRTERPPGGQERQVPSQACQRCRPTVARLAETDPFSQPTRLLLVLRLALRLGRQRRDGEPDVLRQPGVALLELVRVRWCHLAVQRLVRAITAELYQLDGFSDQFADLVRRAKHDRSGSKADDWRQLLSDEVELAKEKENFNNAIKKFGPVDTLLEQLNDIESRKKDLAVRRSRLEHLRSKDLHVSEDIGDLQVQLEGNFQRLAIDSPEFGDLMRLLVPDFYVYLVRLVDGGHPLPRAKIKLSLAGSVQDAALVPGLVELLTREVTIDLFEQPPQRERIRVEAVRLEAEHVPQRQIAARLTEEKPKQAAVQDALNLDRRMKERRLETPYLLVTEPPDDYPKLRRHKNPKYRFQPREGYIRPAI